MAWTVTVGNSHRVAEWRLRRPVLAATKVQSIRDVNYDKLNSKRLQFIVISLLLFTVGFNALLETLRVILETIFPAITQLVQNPGPSNQPLGCSG